jgi:hypothetical protein
MSQKYNKGKEQALQAIAIAIQHNLVQTDDIEHPVQVAQKIVEQVVYNGQKIGVQLKAHKKVPKKLLANANFATLLQDSVCSVIKSSTHVPGTKDLHGFIREVLDSIIEFLTERGIYLSRALAG